MPFPFTDQTLSKNRPALVVSADWFNTLRPDCILAAITSQVPERLQTDEFLIPRNELKQAGLPKPSIVKLGKIFTVEQSQLRKKLGDLPRGTLGDVLRGIANVLS